MKQTAFYMILIFSGFVLGVVADHHSQKMRLAVLDPIPKPGEIWRSIDGNEEDRVDSVKYGIVHFQNLSLGCPQYCLVEPFLKTMHKCGEIKPLHRTATIDSNVFTSATYGIMTRLNKKEHFWQIDSAGRRYNEDGLCCGIRIYDADTLKRKRK
jgi:hypothetical protein